ncbi:hypothetical protein Taro_039734, partial [Colocasia esculenta]|nr:hypothetical protein [Colocasia esculenta]
MEYGSSSRAGGDLTSEVDFIEPSSHCPFPEAVATGYIAPPHMLNIKPLQNNILLHPSMLISRDLTGNIRGCSFFSSPFISWDGLGSPFFTSQAYSAFQVGDTADGDRLF